MKAIPLTSRIRSQKGKGVKNLRSNGIIPATIYGSMIQPINLEVSFDEFSKVYKQAGETGVVNITIDKEIHPSLIKNVQIHPISSTPIHIEFQEVNLKEKIHAYIPVVISGESIAVKEKTGTLLTLINEIEVEALPTDLPEHIVVDISSLTDIDQNITVSQLAIPQGVVCLTDPEIMVVKIGALLAPEPEPQAQPVEGEAVSEVPEGTPTENAANPTPQAESPKE